VVRAFPARVKCANLSWHALRAALEKSGEPVTHRVAERLMLDTLGGGVVVPPTSRFSREKRTATPGLPDNAATSQKPRKVLDAIQHYYNVHNANVHRGALHAGR